MPYSQLPDMIAKLDTAGVTNYQAFSLPGHQHSFSYWPTVKDQALAFLAAGFAGVAPPPPSPAPTPGVLDARQLLNVSTRTRVENGDGVTVGGFIVTGANAKRVVLRGLGPSLAQSGLGATLSDPLLQLFDGNGILVESNDNWKPPGSLTADLIPANTSESLLTAILPAGNYTAVLSGAGGGSGVALFELYGLDPKSSRVSNISTRGQTGTGADVIIGGFIIGGTDSTQVIVRALGPSLGSLAWPGRCRTQSWNCTTATAPSSSRMTTGAQPRSNKSSTRPSRLRTTANQRSSPRSPRAITPRSSPAPAAPWASGWSRFTTCKVDRSRNRRRRHRCRERARQENRFH